MKAKPIIFLCVGIILIFLNVMTDLIGVREPSEDFAYNLGSIIGAHIFGLVGIVLIFKAVKYIRKENKKKEMITDEIIESIGKE